MTFVKKRDRWRQMLADWKENKRKLKMSLENSFRKRSQELKLRLLWQSYVGENARNSRISQAVFTLAKFIAIMLATATSDTHHCSCLGHFGRRKTDRIVSISTQGGQGKNILCPCRQHFLPNNIANVNDPLP
jgi:hypothetical protein